MLLSSSSSSSSSSPQDRPEAASAEPPDNNEGEAAEAANIEDQIKTRNDEGEAAHIEDQIKSQNDGDTVTVAGDGIGVEAWSIYDHALHFLESSFLVYSFADLRCYARENLFDEETCRNILTLPITIESVIELLWRHKSILTEKWGEFDTQLFVDAIDSIEKRMETAAFRAGYKGYAHLIDRGGGIRTFRDNNDEECTYAIAVNGLTRMISVTFRGTKTLNDLSVDAKMAMKTIPNALADIEGQAKTFRLHRGFAGYLFHSLSPSSSELSTPPRRKWNSGRQGTKCQEITDTVLAILEDFPDYTICCTGHSMGGALAAIFAFELATMRLKNQGLIKQAVICTTIASPQFGDNAFRSAFQHLERNDHLRCLRVENDLDVVPLYPLTSMSLVGMPFSMFFPNIRYRHVGVQLKLHVAKERFEIAYPKHRTGFELFVLDVWSTIKRLIWLVLCCVLAAAKEMTNHHCAEYRRRIQVNAEALRSLTFGSIYERIRNGEHGILETRGHLRLKAVEPKL